MTKPKRDAQATEDPRGGHTSAPEEVGAPSLRILKDGTVWLDGKQLPEDEAARYRPAAKPD